MTRKPFYISPNEAVELSKYNVFSDDFQFVLQLQEAFEAQEHKVSDLRWFICDMLACAFTAGRIQGIREERKKHKKPSVSGCCSVPHLGSTMSDFKWQYLTLVDRLNNPDKYKEVDGDVNVVIEKLKAWLNEHISTAAEELTPEELDTLTRALSA